MSVNILCIETSTDICSVCLSVDGKVQVLNEFKEFRHSSQLLPLILSVLDKSSIDKTQLDAICISKGPGSYTGLRVGASTAKGLSFALDIPLIAIDTLTSLANGIIINEGISDSDSLIMPMIDARRDEVYAALYNSNLEVMKSTHPLILNETFSDGFSDLKRLIVCGNGAEKAREHCENVQNITILPSECTAQSLCTLAERAFRNKDFVNLDNFEPNYLKPPRITKPKSPLLKGAN